MDRDEVVRILRANVERFKDDKIRSSFAEWEKTVQYVIQDLGECWTIRITRGEAELVEGRVDTPDLEYQLDSDTFIRLNTGKLSGMVAYASGAVKVKGAVRDMLKWRQLGNSQ